MSLRIAVASAAAAVLALTACSSSKPASSGSTATIAPGGSSSSPAGVTIALTGGVLVGPNGHTLYLNTVDTATKIDCVGACAKEWPPVAGPATVSGGLPAKDFGVATRPDGSIQATYDGHPLYMFDEDKKPGDKKGEGIKDKGGAWHAAKVSESGSPTTGAPTSTPPPTMSTSGGYTY